MTSERTQINYCRETDTFHHCDAHSDGTDVEIRGFPLSLCVRVGTWCNYSCNYCLSSSNSQGTWAPPRLFNDVCAFLRVAGGPRRIVISGGEPTFYPGIEPYLKILSLEGHSIVVATNGSCRLLCAKQYVSWIDVSLHVVNKQTHYRNTHSKGKFSSVLGMIESYATDGINVACSIVVTDENLIELRHALLKAVEAGARKVRIEGILRIGRGRTVRVPSLDYTFLADLKNELLASGAKVVFIPRPSLADDNWINRGYFIVMPTSVLRAEVVGPSISEHYAALDFIRQRWEIHKRVFVSQ